MARKETKGFVQLEWICPNCDGRNPGPIKTCQNCGAPQPDNVQFHRAADEKIITDEKAVAAAKAGADIHCGFCGTRNPATASTCSQCGADLKEGKARAAGQVLQSAPPAPKVVTCTNCGTENPGSERMCAKCGSPLPRAATVPTQAAAISAQAQTSVTPTNTAKKKTNWLLFGGIGAFLLICCIAAVLIFAIPSKTLTGTVADVRWQTSVPIQEIEPVKHSNESGNPPSDAYNVSCREESQEVCEEKTIDKGNGFGEQVQECYTEVTQYCSYTVDEWNTIQTYTLEGNDLQPVYDSPNISGDQRLGSASEAFFVFFNTNDGQLTYTPGSTSEFQQFDIGSEWTIKLNAVGSIVSVER